MKFTVQLIRDQELSRQLRGFNVTSSLGGSLKNVRGDASVGPIESAINRHASKQISLVEKRLARRLGMKVIPSVGGLGAIPDLVSSKPAAVPTESVVGEIKAIAPELSGFAFEKLLTGQQIPSSRKGLVGFGTSIKLTTTGVDIAAGAARRLITGVDTKGKQQISDFEISETDAFVNTYIKNQALLKKHLANPSQAPETVRNVVSGLRRNLMLKAKSIFVPVAINNSTVAVGHLSFNTDDIFSEKFAQVVIKDSENAISVNIEIPQRVLNEVFRDASKDMFDALTAQDMLDATNRFIESKLKEKKSLSKDYGQALVEAAQILKKNRISVDAEFARGSIIASAISFKKPPKKAVKTALPSLIDITVAVRGRARLRMRRGVGDPRPPKIYERSGTFRSSIEAVADLRQRRINYFYLPYYDSLEAYGYEINDLVEGSIRAVSQKLFGQQFILQRNNTSNI